MSQREFARDVLAPNPQTGKPFDARTLRKIFKGERGYVAFQRKQRGGGQRFVQYVRDKRGKLYAFRLEIPQGMDVTDVMRTQRGHDLRLAAAKRAAEKRVNYYEDKRNPSRIQTTEGMTLSREWRAAARRSKSPISPEIIRTFGQ